ncbi:SCP2 sterol-binding domain-containing protein [Amylostereum chailletii]|nr:SCP2 sterol-binding domain-containing protein [Amylostereum chailletii]
MRTSSLISSLLPIVPQRTHSLRPPTTRNSSSSQPNMSDIAVPGFKSSDILATLATVFDGYSEAEKKAQIKKTNGIFQLQVKNAAGEEGLWTIDMKKTGTVYKGAAKPKADVTIILSDEVFTALAAGKLDGQKAFMTGKLKTKGNMMLATKLDGVLKAAKTKAKL